MSQFSHFSNINIWKQITERSHNYNILKQPHQQDIFGRGKGKRRSIGLKRSLKRTFQNIIHQQTNGNCTSVSMKKTQKNSEQNYWNLNILLNFITDFLLPFDIQ